jgi:ATP synthase subunit 6
MKILKLDFSITNFFLVNCLTILGVSGLPRFNELKIRHGQVSAYFIPNLWQKALESPSELTAQLISDTISTNTKYYFPLVLVLLYFILFSNVIGLIPYSFTSTSHLIVTFILSFSVFNGINIITIKHYAEKIFALFLPSNTAFFLALLLTPIEFISYIAKPISLGVRLFINLMAGHSLLKVIIGFSWSMILLETFNSIGFIVPLLILVILFCLELGVAIIQTYVFLILTCIYIEDGQ